MRVHLLCVAVGLCLASLEVRGTLVAFAWRLGTRQPNLPEAEVCGIARDYLLPSHTAYQTLEQLTTVDSNGQVRYLSGFHLVVV